MSDDGNLRPMFRRNLPDFFWVSVETGGTEVGVADSFFCRGGVQGWIEFKQTKANKIKSLDADQVAWHAKLARKGGRSFFAVRRKRELFLFDGGAGDVLFRNGVDYAFPMGVWQMPWPWQEIGLKLLSN